MSATGRGAERQPMDFYRTPGWAVRAALPILGEPKTVLDLGCGDGAIGVELRVALGTLPTVVGVELEAGRAAKAQRLRTADGVLAYDEVHLQDVAGWQGKPWRGGRSDLVIANPPYTLATAFADVAHLAVRPGGRIAFLLAIDWASSRERKIWHREHPSDIHVLERRPSFGKFKRPCKACSGTGQRSSPIPGDPPGDSARCDKCRGKKTLVSGTDSKQYAWFVWGLGLGGRWSILDCEVPANRGAKKV